MARDGHGDDGLGRRARRGPRARRGRGGGLEPAARGHQSLGRARRAGQRHRRHGSARSSEFHEVGDTIKQFASEDATVVIGTVIDPEMADEMRVTVVATGHRVGAGPPQRPSRRSPAKCAAGAEARRKPSYTGSSRRASVAAQAQRSATALSDRQRRLERCSTSRRSCAGRRTDSRCRAPAERRRVYACARYAGLVASSAPA